MKVQTRNISGPFYFLSPKMLMVWAQNKSKFKNQKPRKALICDQFGLLFLFRLLNFATKFPFI